MTEQHDAPEGGRYPETMSNADWLNAALGWIAAGEMDLAKAKIEEVAEELAAEQDLRDRSKDAAGIVGEAIAVVRAAQGPHTIAPAPPAPSGLVDAVRAYQPTLVDMEVRVGGSYRMPDGRSFWIDGVTAREIAKRALGLSPSSNDRLQRRPV